VARLVYDPGVPGPNKVPAASAGKPAGA
jgi:hypothetical protein